MHSTFFLAMANVQNSDHALNDKTEQFWICVCLHSKGNTSIVIKGQLISEDFFPIIKYFKKTKKFVIYFFSLYEWSDQKNKINLLC